MNAYIDNHSLQATQQQQQQQNQQQQESMESMKVDYLESSFQQQHSKERMTSIPQEKLHRTCQFHHSSVRYIHAGMYSDAIHSIIQGLVALEVTLVHDEHDDSSNSSSSSTSSSTSSTSTTAMEEQQYDGDLIIHRNPMDPSGSFSLNPPSDLILVALIYNLGLAYHLYAMTEHNQDPNYLSAVLQDALKLYQATEKRIRFLKSASPSSSADFIIPALRNNMRHAILSQANTKAQRSTSTTSTM